MKDKVHTLTVKVRFDKPVSKAAAARALRNEHSGSEFYASIETNEQDGWNKARIGAVSIPATTKLPTQVEV